MSFMGQTSTWEVPVMFAGILIVLGLLVHFGQTSLVDEQMGDWAPQHGRIDDPPFIFGPVYCTIPVVGADWMCEGYWLF